MRKLISFLFLFSCACAAFAAPWGILTDAAVERGDGVPRFVIFKVASGEPINYCIDNFSSVSDETVSSRVEQAFNEWMGNTYKYIRKSSRTKEFEDLKDILTRPVKLNKVDCGYLAYDKEEDIPSALKEVNKQRTVPASEDIRFIFVNQGKSADCSRGSSTGCHRGGQKTSKGFIPQQIQVIATNEGYSTLLHEVGHSLGLSDQYLSARSNSYELYGSSMVNPSIMDDAQTIKCDDAEGIINVLDCVVFKKARGGQEGWHSICPGSKDVYINCSAKGRGELIALSKSKKYVAITEYDEKGQHINTTRLANEGNNAFYDIFTKTKEDFSEEKRDQKGRVIFLKDKEGAETKISYPKDGIMETFTLKNSKFSPEDKIVSGNSTVSVVISGGAKSAKIFNALSDFGEEKIEIVKTKTFGTGNIFKEMNVDGKSLYVRDYYQEVGAFRLRYIVEGNTYFAAAKELSGADRVDVCTMSADLSSAACMTVTVPQNKQYKILKSADPSYAVQSFIKKTFKDVRTISSAEHFAKDGNDETDKELIGNILAKLYYDRKYYKDFFPFYYHIATRGETKKISDIKRISDKIKQGKVKNGKYKL